MSKHFYLVQPAAVAAENLPKRNWLRTIHSKNNIQRNRAWYAMILCELIPNSANFDRVGANDYSPVSM